LLFCSLVSQTEGFRKRRVCVHSAVGISGGAMTEAGWWRSAARLHFPGDCT